MEGYFNDHCYFPVELSEQLKKKFEENVLSCSDSRTISSDYCETRKFGSQRNAALQHVQDEAGTEMQFVTGYHPNISFASNLTSDIFF